MILGPLEGSDELPEAAASEERYRAGLVAACAGLSARLFARTCTESACSHSSSTAGHAVTLTLCTVPADVTVIEGDSYRVRESEQETAARRRKK